MSTEVILYDLPSRSSPPICWSLNPWKTRAALNFKNIPYRTDWTEYPDLAPKLRSFNIAPNPEGSLSAYSSPTVTLPDGRYVMDSRAIATELEKIQPEPSLHLDSGYVERVQSIVAEIQKALGTQLYPRVAEMVLPERSKAYFLETREKRFGMPLPEMAKREIVWEDVDAGLQKLVAVLREHDGGSFVMGKTASYADIILAGFWRFVEILDKGDILERCMSHDGVVRAQYSACAKWLERDDH